MILSRSVISLHRTAIDDAAPEQQLLGVRSKEAFDAYAQLQFLSHRRDAMPVGFTRSDGRAVNRR
jgi:hypothetical protein